MIGFKGHSSFSGQPILAAVDKAARRVLQRFGFAVRQDAMESIEESAGPAPAGSPPHSHAREARRAVNAKRKAAGKSKLRGRGFAGLRFIQYFVDGARSVIIGPASNRTRSITIPEILEEGKADVPQHPFMGPAYRKKLPTLPAMWAGSVKP